MSQSSMPLAPSAARYKMVHPWLTAEEYAAILAEARKRGTHVDRLAAELLKAIVEDNLFRAVLES